MSSSLRLILSVIISIQALQSVAEPIVIGESLRFYSDVLQEERPLKVYLPDSYNSAGQAHYPVLYVLDGETHFKKAVGTVDWLAYNGNAGSTIPEHIIIAVDNTAGNRSRDLSPTPNQNGRNEKFIQFLTAELTPYVDEKFRTHPFRVLSGHSASGEFVIQMLMEKSNFFGGYIAASPGFSDQPGSLLGEIKTSLDQWEGVAFLYTTLGDEPRRRQAHDNFISLLENATPVGLSWQNRFLLSEVHMTTPGLSLHYGLSLLYADLLLSSDSEISKGGSESIRDYFESLSQSKYGYPLSSEQSLRSLAFSLRSTGDMAAAIAVLKDLSLEYPYSVRAHFDLASFYERDSQFENALNAIIEAIDVATQEPNYNGMERLAVIKQRLENRE